MEPYDAAVHYYRNSRLFICISDGIL